MIKSIQTNTSPLKTSISDSINVFTKALKQIHSQQDVLHLLSHQSNLTIFPANRTALEEAFVRVLCDNSTFLGRKFKSALTLLPSTKPINTYAKELIKTVIDTYLAQGKSLHSKKTICRIIEQLSNIHRIYHREAIEDELLSEDLKSTFTGKQDPINYVYSPDRLHQFSHSVVTDPVYEYEHFKRQLLKLNTMFNSASNIDQKEYIRPVSYTHLRAHET